MHARIFVMLRGVMNETLHQPTDAATNPTSPETTFNALRREFPDRLVTLSTGQAGLRGALAVKVAMPPATEPLDSLTRGNPSTGAAETRAPVIDFIASDATLDRTGEIILANGWRLENFRRNPVFQNAHNYGNIVFTLGRALLTEVREGRLFLRVLFATDINPMARLAYDMYRRGFLNAVSVGFLPLRWENGNDHTSFRRRFLEQELLEVSAVAVPANPNALSLALKAGAVEQSDLQALHALLQATLAQNNSAMAELLHLARTVAKALA
jgi:HK97 family phage prohead protease